MLQGPFSWNNWMDAEDLDLSCETPSKALNHGYLSALPTSQECCEDKTGKGKLHSLPELL